jgi:hypothetical protein
MNPNGTVRLLLTANLVVLTIGAIDAGVDGDWDLFVVFAIALGIGIALLLRVESRRPAIPVRRDLVAWLRDRASISGESLESVTDRAIATYAERYGLVMDVDKARQ